MGYVATKSRPRYLDTDLKAEFAGDNPDYFDVKTNKWYSTSSGSELVTNGTFTTNTTGWTAGDAESLLSIVNSTLKITSNDSGTGYCTQNISTSVGKKYIFKVNIVSNPFNMCARISGVSIPNTTTVGSYVYEHTATSTTTEILLAGTAGIGNYTQFDNVSVFQSDLTIGSEITPRNYLNNIVYADHNGQPEYVEELPKVEYKDVIKANEYRGKNACTAWVNFDGTTTPPTIRDSYNVSSVVRTSTGSFDVYFAIPMDNVNYSVSCSANALDGSSSPSIGLAQNSISPVKMEKVSIVTTVGDIGSRSNFVTNSLQIFGGKNV